MPELWIEYFVRKGKLDKITRDNCLVVELAPSEPDVSRINEKKEFLSSGRSEMLTRL